MRSILAILMFLLTGATSAAAPAPCRGPTGLYAGSATTPDGVTADVTLNLYCDGSRFAAQLFTSMGDFDVKAATVAQDHVRIDFDSGAALGTLDLNWDGTTLSGPVLLADERGSASLTRKSDPLAPDALTPRLDLTDRQSTRLNPRHASASRLA